MASLAALAALPARSGPSSPSGDKVIQISTRRIITHRTKILVGWVCIEYCNFCFEQTKYIQRPTYLPTYVLNVVYEERNSSLDLQVLAWSSSSISSCSTLPSAKYSTQVGTLHTYTCTVALAQFSHRHRNHAKFARTEREHLLPCATFTLHFVPSGSPSKSSQCYLM